MQSLVFGFEVETAFVLVDVFDGLVVELFQPEWVSNVHFHLLVFEPESVVVVVSQVEEGSGLGWVAAVEESGVEPGSDILNSPAHS